MGWIYNFVENDKNQTIAILAFKEFHIVKVCTMEKKTNWGYNKTIYEKKKLTLFYFEDRTNRSKNGNKNRV